jgi:hypothetical protein
MAGSITTSTSGGLGWSLGPYFIISSIGSGKFGTVYFATEEPSGREVALKLVPLDGTDSDEKVEAERLGAHLQQKFGEAHKGLVPEIFDHQPRASFYAIAMELVRGEQLRDVITRGPLPPRRAGEIALAIARFLEHAHRFETDVEGVHYGLIVHADLKPDHILLLPPKDEIRVLDFGIAKALAERTAVTTNKWGSMPYASPERLQSDGHVNEHADFWSLGIILFEMVAGFRPYRRVEHNPSRLNAAIITHEPFEPLPNSAHPVLAAIIRKLLAPQIERRYSSASAIAADLDAFLNGGETVAAAEQARASEQTVRINAKADIDTVATDVLAPAGAAAVAAHALPPADIVATDRPLSSADLAVASAPPPPGVGAAASPAPGLPPLPTAAGHTPWPRRATPPPLPRMDPVATDPLPPPIPPTEAVPKSGSRLPIAPPLPLPLPPPLPGPMRAPLARRLGKVAAAVILITVVAAEGVALTRAERVRAQVAALEVEDIQAMREDYRDIAGWSPLSIAEARVGRALVDRMLELANRTIHEYRTESPSVAEVQWQQAREALELAAEISGSREVRSKLLYVTGQLKRIGAGNNRAQYDAAIRDFEEAARLDTESPDPYLGMARIYAYALWDEDALAGAVREAQERGYKPGRRERAQMGDVHRLNAERARVAAAKASGDARIQQLERARDGFAKCVKYFDGLRFYGSDDNLRTCRRRLAMVEAALATPTAAPLPEPPSFQTEPSALLPEGTTIIPKPKNEAPPPRPEPESEPAPLPPSQNPILPKPAGNRPPGVDF